MDIPDLREQMGFPKKPDFPPAVQEVFNALRNEVTFLHGIWDQYEELFGTPESVAALNDTAPGAFSFIGYVFRHELVMTIARITDPKAMGKFENLTLKQLQHVVSQNCADQGFLDDLEARMKVIDDLCEPFRARRNRTLAHLDLRTALNAHPEPLPAVERERIENVLRLTADFMNEVLGQYTSIYADFVPNMTGPAGNIVHGLREFQRLRKLEYERELAAIQAEAELYNRQKVV